MEIYKLPPQALDLEQTVLGGLLIDSDAYDKTVEFLKDEVFYNRSHQLVFTAIRELVNKNMPVDIRTVVNQLKANNTLDLVKGPAFIADLTSGLGTTANIQTHAAILYEKYLRRELIRISSDMVSDAYDEEKDVFNLISQQQDILDKLIRFNTNDFSPQKRLAEARESVYKAHNSKTGLSGVSTGYESIDKFTGGLQPGDLIVVGGWPGTFKSALTLAILHNAEKTGMPTMMFEQEMSGRQVGMREIAMDTGITTESLKTGQVTKEQLELMEQSIGRIENKKVFMDLSSGIKIGRIKSILRKLKKEEGVGLAVIDYLGLCDLEVKKYGGQEPAIDNFCRELKILAKELDIPIILLAQFVKESASEKLKPPHAGFLKGSGAIEAHSDMVWLLWNPAATDQYFQYDFGDGQGLQSCYGKLGIVFPKNRQGRVGLMALNVKPETNRFSDIKNEYF